MAEQVHGHGDDVHVAGAFPVAEKGAFHPVGACQQTQFGIRHGTAPVIVGVEGDDDVFPVVKVLAHVLHLAGIDVGRTHLHRHRQIDNHRPFLGGLPNVDDPVADLQGKFRFGAGEGFRRVLKAVVILVALHVLVEQLCALYGNVDDGVFVPLKYLFPLGHTGGVIQVDNGVLAALQSFKSALDNVFPGLGQHLDGDVVRDQILFNQGAQKFKFRFAGGRESHFDFLKADLHQILEEVQLFLQAHRHHQGLVAVPQIHAAPDGGMVHGILFHPVVAGFRGKKKSLLILVCIFHLVHSPFLAELSAKPNQDSLDGWVKLEKRGFFRHKKTFI